jgi:hypothetical protein
VVDEPIQPIQAAPAPLTPQAPPPADLSRATIAVLVLLTLTISVLGTWTVLTQAGSSNSRIPQSASGTAQISILQTQHAAVTASSPATATITILPKPTR